MKHLIKLTFLIFIHVSCESNQKEDSSEPDFPYSLSQILKHKMIGESVDFSSIYPDSSEAISKLFCDTFNTNQNLHLEKGLTLIDSNTYHFFHASPLTEKPWICYSGTFYFNIEHLNSLFQYSEEFNYPTDSLTE